MFKSRCAAHTPAQAHRHNYGKNYKFTCSQYDHYARLQDVTMDTMANTVHFLSSIKCSQMISLDLTYMLVA